MKNFLTEQYVKLSTALQCRKGQTLVEYALLLVLIAIVVIAAVRIVGTQTNTVYSKIGCSLN
jgi:pilus assembly protein Flp/PilA